MVPDERSIWRFNPAFGSSRIASSAYQKRPTKSSLFTNVFKLRKTIIRAHLKFENELRLLQPQGS